MTTPPASSPSATNRSRHGLAFRLPSVGCDTLHDVEHNPQNGRPVRKSAGKNEFHEMGYVSWKALQDEDITDGEPTEADRARAKRQRQLEASGNSTNDSRVQEPGNGLVFTSTETLPHRVRCLINIPPAQPGPFVTYLTANDITSVTEMTLSLTLRDAIPSLVAGDMPGGTTGRPHGRFGFLKLPPELRNKVYRSLFVADWGLNFDTCENLCLSASFLSTCHTVYKEASPVLYGANSFFFKRRNLRRGHYFDRTWQEIGYGDTLAFLTAARRCLRYISKITILLQDALPSNNPSGDRELGRFVLDNNLRTLLGIIATECRGLKAFYVGFHGAKQLKFSNAYGFCDLLMKIRGLDIFDLDRIFTNKVDDLVVEELKSVMMS